MLQRWNELSIKENIFSFLNFTNDNFNIYLNRRIIESLKDTSENITSIVWSIRLKHFDTFRYLCSHKSTSFKWIKNFK